MRSFDTDWLLLALLCDEYRAPHIAGAEALPVELEDGELEEGEL